MRCFGDVFEKNIDINVFDDVLHNAKHRANDASNDVNRPPLAAEARHASSKGLLKEKFAKCSLYFSLSCVMVIVFVADFVFWLVLSCLLLSRRGKARIK